MTMSNPNPAPTPRQRLHKRQNSTPALESIKVPSMPPTVQRHSFHRRGQSLDQQRSPIRRQTGSTVSITNLGSTPHGQQILREAQQQKARPGQQEIPASPQCGLVAYSPTTINTTDTTYGNATAMNAIMQNARNMPVAQSPFYTQDLNMPLSAGFESIGFNLDENSQYYFQPSNISRADFVDGQVDARRMSQPELHLYTGQRPITPTQQVSQGQFPLTPATTPFKQNISRLQRQRSAQSSPIKAHADEPIRAPCPISMQRGRSLEGIFETREVDQPAMSPPSTAPLLASSPFDMAEMPIPELLSSPVAPIAVSYSDPSQTSSQDASATLSMTQPSFESSQAETLPFFDETGGEVPSLSTNPIPVLSLPKSVASGPASPTRAALSPRRMSISDLNLDPGISASIQETHVTLDDIAQYIEGPDPVDNKWKCVFEECGKRFGRKENIKSHVQTHLDDRQFQCDHCNKRFVRGHDLKRHAKIHTGTKPYPCLCGNAFARHDALTRHRQRGMCIGAFDGVVKKIIKRGRPRKHRPEMDERLDKASKTRRRARERENQYESSASSCSRSSWGDSPPTETLETLSIRGGSPPFDDMALFGTPNSHHPSQMPVESFGFPPDLFTFTPPASPGYSTGNKPSPQHRSLTPTDTADLPDLLPPNSMASALLDPAMAALDASQHGDPPPSLSHSTSSPAPDIAAFDFGGGGSGDSGDDATVGLGGGMHHHLHKTGGLKMIVGAADHQETANSIPGADFDSFLDYDGIGLESDPVADDFFEGY